MDFVAVHDTTPISWPDLSLLGGALTSSSTFTSCAFLSHWWMRNKAQMFKSCLLVLVTIDAMVWKRRHHNGIFKNPARLFHVLQHSIVQIYLSSLSWPFIPFGIMRRMLESVPAAYGRCIPEWVASSSHAPLWAFGGAVPCSRVFSQCSEGVSAPLLLPEHFTCLDISYLSFWNINVHALGLFIGHFSVFIIVNHCSIHQSFQSLSVCSHLKCLHLTIHVFLTPVQWVLSLVEAFGSSRGMVSHYFKSASEQTPVHLGSSSK